ncbi:MAG: HD domain-containing protein [Muriicola sp.]|nr:HD domain-containing protein [Muriicola sp.]
MTRYLKLRRKALHMLQTELSEDLCYHGMAHTLDVLKVCDGYIRREKLYGEKAMLLRTGALCHDLGFTISYENHEEHGITIALQMMKDYRYSPVQRKVVVGLIRATEVPQTPKTHLERILCDADLDYLGRDDYGKISNLLLMELKRFGVALTKEGWRQKQISFLQKHNYHTPYAQKYREPVKQDHLKTIKEETSS